MGTKYEVRTKDGVSHYIDSFISFVTFMTKNIGNMYYFRINL